MDQDFIALERRTEALVTPRLVGFLTAFACLFSAALMYFAR
jgi:hypothetical protein